MKTCRWGSDSTLMLCIDSLVPFFIFFVWFAFDIFRQWSFTELFQLSSEIFLTSFPQKPDCAATAGCIVNDLCYQVFLFAEIQFVSDADLSGGINNHVPKPVGFIEFSQEKYFDLGAGLFLTAVHAGGKNLRVVYNENIFVVEIVEYVPEMFVFDLAGMAVDYHHAGIFTFLGRILSDKV